MQRRKSGFTLIEMLVVIAVVAILVTVIMPTVTDTLAKAKAATDAANLHLILGKANSEIYVSNFDNTISCLKKENVRCATFKGAEMYIAYAYPGFIEIMFIDGGLDSAGAQYYGIQYFSEVAATGTSSQSTAKPEFPDGVVPEWINVTEAVVQ